PHYLTRPAGLPVWVKRPTLRCPQADLARPNRDAPKRCQRPEEGLIWRRAAANGHALSRTAIDPTPLPPYLRAVGKLTTLTLPDPILRKTSLPIEHVGESVRTLAGAMLETMYAAPGVGLAAVQVGVLRRLIVLDTAKGEDEPPRPLIMINPQII